MTPTRPSTSRTPLQSTTQRGMAGPHSQRLPSPNLPWCSYTGGYYWWAGLQSLAKELQVQSTSTTGKSGWHLKSLPCPLPAHCVPLPAMEHRSSLWVACALNRPPKHQMLQRSSTVIPIHGRHYVRYQFLFMLPVALLSTMPCMCQVATTPGNRRGGIKRLLAFHYHLVPSLIGRESALHPTSMVTAHPWLGCSLSFPVVTKTGQNKTY